MSLLLRPYGNPGLLLGSSDVLRCFSQPVIASIALDAAIFHERRRACLITFQL